MSKQDHWDSMYKLPLKDIPWEIKNPPRELFEVLRNGLIKNGKALDVACGTGNYSLCLARNSFSVTGVDFSKEALKIAQRKAQRQKLQIKFIYADVLSLTKVLHEKFNFILDYSLLHHINSDKITAYVSQFLHLLKKKGRLLMVCYSNKDSQDEKFSVGKYGNVMYYRTAGQIRRLYKGLKEIMYKETRLGKRLQHYGHCFLFEK